MPKSDRIKPFKATFYNPQKFKKFEKLVCPPYDVITSQAAFKYRQSSPYNFCNILLKNGESYDDLQKIFTGWVKDKVLVDDPKPNFYLTCQTFKLKGRVFKRYGFLGLLKINEEAVIYPHEKTHSAPKKDRLAMMENLKANLSPIFLIYPKKEGDPVEGLVKKLSRKKPSLRVSDKDGILYKVWKVSNKKAISDIGGYFGGVKLLIADGHHRFEVARKFYRQNKHKIHRYSNLNYILAYLTPQDKNLLVLPTHRVLSQKVNLEKLMKNLKPYFDISKHASKKQVSHMLNKANTPFSFVLYQDKAFIYLCLKNERVLDKIKPEYRNLDVDILHELIFKKILEFDPADIEYSKDITESTQLADGYKGCSFILRKPDIGAIMNLALKGRKLPQKTTYFYPKFLSGLILRRL